MDRFAITCRLTFRSLSAVLMVAGAAQLAGCADEDRRPTVLSPAITSQGPNERQREIDRLTADGPLGFVDATNQRIAYFFSDVSDGISGAPARYGQMLEDKQNPDIRRDGITGLVERPWGQTGSFPIAYARLAEDTAQDPLVRATALRALNRCREVRFTALYAKCLNDSSELIRLEACKALGHMPDPRAVPDLIRLISRGEEPKDVRIAAIDAARHYRRIDVARALTAMLNDRDFSLSWSALQSLQFLTGKDFGYDEAKWLGYLGSPDADKPLS